MSLFNIPDDEEWRDVVGFEGFYQVSNLGRVKSLDRTTCDGKQLKGRIIAPVGTRYLSANLWMNGKSYNKMVHRIVGEAFVSNPDNLLEINHKDKNTTNNRADNLEWVTSSDNHNHGVSTRKSYSYRKKVKCLETDEVFDSISAAGRSVNADATQIVESIQANRCCKGKTFVYADSIPENPQKYMDDAHAKYQSFHKRPNMKNARKVECIETGRVFDSIASAASFYKCDTATISNRIKASMTVNGVTLRFKDKIQPLI